MRETALKGADCGFGSSRKECRGTHEHGDHRFACTPRCLCVVGGVCSGPVGLRSGRGTLLGSSSSSTSIRLLAVILFLTASELELAHCLARRRPKPDRACAAAAPRSCVEWGLPSYSWLLATILKCHAVSRTAYISLRDILSLPLIDRPARLHIHAQSPLFTYRREIIIPTFHNNLFRDGAGEGIMSVKEETGSNIIGVRREFCENKAQGYFGGKYYKSSQMFVVQGYERTMN